jgi:hypothetical protein
MSRLLDDGELPTRGGQRPHLVLTMGLNEIIDGLGTAVLDTGGQLCAAEARRLACDAAIIPMVLGSLDAIGCRTPTTPGHRRPTRRAWPTR